MDRIHPSCGEGKQCESSFWDSHGLLLCGTVARVPSPTHPLTLPTRSRALPDAVCCPHLFARRPHPFSCLRTTHLPFAQTRSHQPNPLAMPCDYALPNRSFARRPTYTDPTHPTGLHLCATLHARACTVPLAVSV